MYTLHKKQNQEIYASQNFLGEDALASSWAFDCPKILAAEKWLAY